MRLVLLLLFASLSEEVVLPSIPAHLLPCYRGGGPNLSAPKRLDVFLSLLKKLEQSSKLSMRMFSGSLLQSLRLDGIQESANAVESDFLLPFRAYGFQFHRYQLMMDLFLPVAENFLDINGTLSVTETCLLHKMLSSTVRQWERGDENVVCPLSAQQRQNMATQSSGRINSRCPIEEGVIQTDWGTISAGHLVSAIAASLEPQRVLVTDILNTDIFKAGVSEPLMTSAKQEWFENIEAFNVGELPASPEIGNIGVATLVGDLAEVIINQGPRVGADPRLLVVGSSNRWNDTYLPRDYYLLPQNASIIDWHLTDAEILSGIDGLIIAHYLPDWIEQRRSLRLSQVLDMYYSHEGVSFNPSVRACNRQALFNEVVKREEIVAEASRFAHVLSLRQITVYIPVEEMERIASAAVTTLMTNAPTVMRDNHLACHVSNSVPFVDMIVATDGSWTKYEVEQFISWIGGALEINLQPNTLGLLHGNTGQWIVPPSGNLIEVFDYLDNFTDTWPSRLNIVNVITRITAYSIDKSLEESALKASVGPSTMALVISPGGRPSSVELIKSSELMQSLRNSFFDVYFAYVARDVTDFQNINNEYLDYSELFLKVPSTTVKDVIDAVDTYVVTNEIPSRIFGPHCPFNGTTFEQVEYEDSVLPGRKVTYRIHPFYLQLQPLIKIELRNDRHGELVACSWRGADPSRSCATIPTTGTHTFNLTKPCPSQDFCPPAYFSVAATETFNRCAHDDCRLPQQVSYYISHSGLRCLPLRNSSTKISSQLLLILLTYFYISKMFYVHIIEM